MSEINELRDLLKSSLNQIEKHDADRVERLLRRLETRTEMLEKKYNRATQDREAGHSLLKKTSDDLIQRYLAIFEHSGNPMVVIENDGTIVLVNNLFCTLTGQNAEDIQNRSNITDYLTGEMGGLMPADTTQTGQAPVTTETTTGRMHLPDGRIVDVIISMGSFSGSSQRSVTFLDITERNRLERELMETTELLTGILKASPVGFHKTDTEGKIVYINDTWTRITGFSREEMLGKFYAIIVHPEDRENVIQGVRESAERKESMVIDTRIVRQDGVIRWISAQAVPVVDPGNNITGWVGAIRDITQRREAEEALHKSELRFRELTDLLPQTIFELDLRGSITYVNRAGLEIFGINEEKIQNGVNVREYISPGDLERMNTGLARVGAGAKSQGEVVHLTRLDGTLMNAIVYTGPIIRNDAVIGFRGIVIDVTERLKLEDALKESEEKYRALTENTPDILFSTDMNGIITYASPQIAKYGFLEDDVMGKPFHIFVHPSDVHDVESNLSRELKENAQFVSRFRILDKWGITNWFEEKSSLRLDISGKPIGIYGILRDITERKKVEDAIEIANKKLNLMNQITRHDIINTITGVLGCLDMAKSTTEPEMKEQLLDDIRELTRVIQRHITFTREYQEVGVHLPQWQNVNDLIDKTIKNFTKSGIIFQSDFENIEVYADPLLEKVFYNLVDNAIRYGKKLTTIAIYPKISDTDFSLIFEDNGVGVEPDMKREIFKRGVGKNTGMGLFLTAEILAITGISIEEAGTYGKGACFEIRIPAGYWRFVTEEHAR